MTKDEWKLHYGFSDEDMEFISKVRETADGTITAVNNCVLDYEIIKLDKL